MPADRKKLQAEGMQLKVAVILPFSMFEDWWPE
jgi:hypothetical protein